MVLLFLIMSMPYNFIKSQRTTFQILVPSCTLVRKVCALVAPHAHHLLVPSTAIFGFTHCGGCACASASFPAHGPGAEVERLPCALSTFLLDSVVLANSVSPTLVNIPVKRAAEHPCRLLENSFVSPDGSLLTIHYLATLLSLPS